MCTSRYFWVIERLEGDAVLAEDADGCRRRLALVAYEGPPLRPGSWIVAHAGYALAPADDDEVETALDELRRSVDAGDTDRPKAAARSKEAS